MHFPVSKKKQIFDSDGNGEITPDELITTMKNLGRSLDRERAQEMIQQFDKNRDGQINFEGLKKLIFFFMFTLLFGFITNNLEPVERSYRDFIAKKKIILHTESVGLIQ